MYTALLTLFKIRGYAFLCFLREEDAEKAISEAGGHEIRSGVHMTVSKSEGNRRLYMGNIHKERSEEELLGELETLFSGVKGVVAQQDNTNTQLNRGYYWAGGAVLLIYSTNVLNCFLLVRRPHLI